MMKIHNSTNGTTMRAAMYKSRYVEIFIFLGKFDIFYQTIYCCAPYSLEETLSQYTGANDTITASECGVANCADSYFGDFSKSLNTLNDPLTGCSSGVKVIEKNCVSFFLTRFLFRITSQS